MYCVASYFIVKRGNKSTSTSTVLSASSLDNMVIATTGFHCRTLQRLAPPNVSGSAWNGCAWKSASTGTSRRVLMKISLQPSSGFNPSRERHIKSSSQAGMKRTWKNRNQSRNLPLQFSMAHSFGKEKQSRASALKFYQRRRQKFLEGPGTKKIQRYGEQSHQTRTTFDSLLGVQPHLISRVYML